MNVANYTQHGPFTYELVTATKSEYWGLFAHEPVPAAITAAARAALSCGERGCVGDALIAARWRVSATYGPCGTLTQAIYTDPDETTTALLVTREHTSPGNGYWTITHPHASAQSTADSDIPAPVLIAFLLTATDA